MSLLKFILSKQFLKHIGAALLLTFLIIGGLWYYLKSYTNHNDHILVPNLKGKKVEEVEDLLEDLDLTYSVIDSIWSRDQEGGTVMEQIPDAQSEVKENREIYLTIYRYEPDLKVLDIKEGDDQYVAKIKLGNMGVDFKVVYEANELLAGRVLRIEQEGKRLLQGAKIKPGSEVLLFVGERRDAKVSVPDLTGLTLKEAEKVLITSNLSLGLPFYDEDVQSVEDSLSAKVYSQSPKSQTEEAVREGAGVDVWLSNMEILINRKEDQKKTDE